MAQLWERPGDGPARDMTYGPWGREHAPRASDVYTFEHAKTHGVNPGMTVKDSEGREWSVKQGEESHVEVFLSRILSAIGYHQPPVYFLDSFTLKDNDGVRTETGGRFRLKARQLEDLGEWAWQRNPFVGKTPYNGLLATLMLFGSSDLKNSNNSLYRVHASRAASDGVVRRPRHRHGTRRDGAHQSSKKRSGLLRARAVPDGRRRRICGVRLCRLAQGAGRA